jgi:hypothetical protein
MAGPHNLSVKNLIKLFVFVLPTVSTILALMAMPSQDIMIFLAPKNWLNLFYLSKIKVESFLANACKSYHCL